MCGSAREGRRLKVNLSNIRVESLQGLVGSSMRQDQIAHRETSAGDGVLVKDPTDKGDERRQRETENLGKCRTSTVMNPDLLKD